MAFKGDPDDRKVACLIVRDLALDINNEQDAPETAFRLVDGLIAAGGSRVPADVLEKLREDRATLHRNWKYPELERNKGSFALMEKTINELLKFADADESRKLFDLKEKLQSRRRARNLKWGIGVALCGGFVLWAVMEDQGGARRSSPSGATAPASSSSTIAWPPARQPSTESYAEAVPPVGTDLVLTEPQVRYCTYQGERIEYLRTMANTNRQIDRFNALVDDFNARCSSFRYRVGVLGAVQGEVPGRAAALRADASRIAASW